MVRREEKFVTFSVKFPLPCHATVKMAKTYIEGALICWCDHTSITDPMGEINIHAIQVGLLNVEGDEKKTRSPKKRVGRNLASTDPRFKGGARSGTGNRAGA